MLFSILLILVTIFIYQIFSLLQRKVNYVWCNPLLLSFFTIIPLVLLVGMPYEKYYQATKPLSLLLEPAVVALGFPLYQHLHSIKKQWQAIVSIITLAVIIVITLSLSLVMLIIALPEIAVSLSLKSVTTPIGLALTEELNGNKAITAFSINIAGLLGAILGPQWLNFIGVTSAQAQGLAVGSASHALGSASISKLSYEHAAYASLSLILSAIITAIISPWLIPLLLSIFS